MNTQAETRTLYRNPADFAAGDNPIPVEPGVYEVTLARLRRTYPYAVGVCASTEQGREALVLDLTAARS